MANSAQRRKGIREQNVTMRKALDKLHRKLAVAEIPAAAATPGTPAAIETAGVATEAATQSPKGMAGIKKLLSGKGVKGAAATAGGFILLDLLIRNLLNRQTEGQQYDLANRQMDAQMEGLSPEALKEESLQPITRAQRDYAMQMLMQQMGGRATNRARGEAWT